MNQAWIVELLARLICAILILKNQSKQRPFMTTESTRPVRTKHYFEFALFWFLRAVCLRMSQNTVIRIGNGLGWLMHRLRIYRHIMLTNLTIAFPNLTEAEREQLLYGNYCWIGRVFLEVLQMDNWYKRTHEMVVWKNLELLDEALQENKGVILLGAHFGNWELISPALCEKGYNMHVYVGEQTNPLVNREQNRSRTQFGSTAIERSPKAKFQFVRALRGQNVMGMIADQNDRKSEVFVDFFGKQATFHPGAAGFHLARQIPLLTVFCTWNGEKFEMKFRRLHPELTGDKKADMQLVSQVISKAFEDHISQHPEQYFWMHRRWRTRPPHDRQSVY